MQDEQFEQRLAKAKMRALHLEALLDAERGRKSFPWKPIAGIALVVFVACFVFLM